MVSFPKPEGDADLFKIVDAVDPLGWYLAFASAGKIKAAAIAKTAMTIVTSTNVSAWVTCFERRDFMELPDDLWQFAF